ncbi:MAG: hypothetical protein M0Z67_07870 [Nitrospiraceae bacterium]|nr:hypothetical protein [Nitrospiraceae bacterium]
MKRISARMLVLFLAVFSFTASSCALGNRLAVKSAEESDVTGNFRLILYGCTYNNDLKTIAILDKEGDPYIFEPYAPDFEYRVKKGVPAKEALQEAERFVDCSTAFRSAQLSRLVDAKGETLGFEMRPLYMPFVFGIEDVLHTDYLLEGDKVIVKIWLSRSVEEMMGTGESGEKER